jgi:parallel beta-helix repeat protein
MLTKQALSLAFLIILISLSSSGCNDNDTSKSSASFPFPAEPPDVTIPIEFELDGQLTTIQGQRVHFNSDIENQRFSNCEVSFTGQDMQIRNCEFIDSTVYINDSEDILLERVVFRNLDKYEQATLSLNDSNNITIRDCQFKANYIGLGIHSSSVFISKNRFEHNNGHNALLIGEGSSAEVSGNYFYGSFPHAILVLNRESSEQAAVDIHHNLIDQTGEDAIDFEDYRGASASRVFANIITNSGWSAIIVEYNSWEANITIQNNWIERTGIPWELSVHPLQPDRFQAGWGHGILVEDSSQVSIINNRILLTSGNGIEITNGRNITVAGNGITCSQVGIGLHSFNESSLHRDFSPLTQENAGGSQAIVYDNTIFKSRQDYEVDEFSQLSTSY